jgi:RNA-directed DNA polymerase
MVKAALEPCWEAQFEPTSYGFRPGRSAQDAIARIYVSANPSAKSAQVRDVGKLAKVDPVLLQQLNWATHAFLTKWLNPQFHISQ